MKPSTRNTSMKRLGLELYQLTGENQNIPIKDVRAVVKKNKEEKTSSTYDNEFREKEET